MKQYNKQEMLSLFVANKMQIQVTNSYNLQHCGIALTVEETKDFADHPKVYSRPSDNFGRFCLVVWLLEKGSVSVLPVDIAEVADELYKIFHS
jgi:hypothetical protein